MNDAFMSNMSVGEEIVVVTDARQGMLECRTVNRGVFPEGVVVTNFKIGWATLIFEILGPKPNAGKWEKRVSAADFSISLDDHVRF